MSSSTNTSITPLEESIFQKVGQVTLNNLAATMILTLFFGIFIPLFSMSVYQMMHRGLRTRANWAALVGTSINFAIMTIDWIVSLTWLIFSLQIFLVHNGDLPLEDRISLEVQAENPFLLVLDNLASVPLLISDAFVVWRALILFTETSKWVISIPIICLIATVGLFIASVAVSIDSVAEIAVTWAVSALSLLTNFISTGMIGWRLWIYRKHVLPALGDAKSPVHRVIITLVESGAVFCTLQVASLITQLVSGAASTQNPSLAISITQQVIYGLAAMYPTFILLVCRNHSSRIEQVASLSMIVGNDLRFASAHAPHDASQSMSMVVSAMDFGQQSSHSSTREAKSSASDVELGAS